MYLRMLGAFLGVGVSRQFQRQGRESYRTRTSVRILLSIFLMTLCIVVISENMQQFANRELGDNELLCVAMQPPSDAMRAGILRNRLLYNNNRELARFNLTSSLSAHQRTPELKLKIVYDDIEALISGDADVQMNEGQ